jgi:hypothetical protein
MISKGSTQETSIVFKANIVGGTQAQLLRVYAEQPERVVQDGLLTHNLMIPSRTIKATTLGFFKSTV